MKKLYRTKKDRILAGVCGGMGVYFNIDPNLVRLIWVILGFTGLGIILYVVACCILPEESNIIDAEGEVVDE